MENRKIQWKQNKIPISMSPAPPKCFTREMITDSGGIIVAHEQEWLNFKIQFEKCIFIFCNLFLVACVTVSWNFHFGIAVRGGWAASSSTTVGKFFHKCFLVFFFIRGKFSFFKLQKWKLFNFSWRMLPPVAPSYTGSQRCGKRAVKWVTLMAKKNLIRN